MDYFFIAYLAMLVFLFTKLRRLQQSAAFHAAFGLLILAPLASIAGSLDYLTEDHLKAIISAIMALSMFNLGRALFEPAETK
jgi:uncharacterized membrane protein